MVGRFGGDKFGIILTDLLSKEEATGFADRLAKRLAEPYTLEGRQVFTSAKIGIAYGNSKYPEAEDIFRDADIAMYYAKDNEENYVIFDQKMHIRAVTRLQLETDLRFAIERNEFELYYQPIIRLDDASLTGFEALVRWNHPQRGLVPPYEFIPISESTGLIIPMTVQILHSACKQIVEWQKRWPTEKPLNDCRKSVRQAFWTSGSRRTDKDRNQRNRNTSVEPKTRTHRKRRHGKRRDQRS